MERTIKFTVSARRWFDKANGNTYHSVKVIREKDGAVLLAPMQYGYDEHYRQTAHEIMLKAGWLPKNYNEKNYWRYERENNYPIDWNVEDGTKRTCVALGLGK